MSIKLADMLDRVDATSARHRNVHNDDVRLLVFVALIGRRSVAGFTDDRYPFVLCKERAVPFANDGVVVDQNDRGVVVQLIDLAVVAKATGRADEGATVQVRVDAAEIETGKVALSVVG